MIPTDIKNIDLSKHTVLAVDDIPMNLLLISKILSRLNITISTATNGREALEFIEKNKPSLVLLDLMMPEIDGYEVLRRLRENPETKDLRVVILSALNSNEDIVKGFNMGANDFITKPIILEKLTSCVVTQLQLVELAGK
ncbi:MAG: response regulator [Bacteroidaceae bacterium]|jgi:Response regulator containing a CheY-like receiver domain and a GGDEF domain|nr:response regulator [Bacteroidaceae bacterium]MBR6857575.1 response regulator [Bacteroidaceae bacterium]